MNTSSELYIDSATVTNNGTLTMESGSEIYGYGGTGTPVFDNAGNLVANPGSTGTATLYGNGELVVNNTGSIQLSSGTLDVQSATLNLNTGSSVSGSGTLEDQGTLGVNTAQSLGNSLSLQGGTLSVGPNVTLNCHRCPAWREG